MRAIIWGCGTMGRRVFKPLCDYYNMEIIAYTDSSEDKWGGVIYNTPVVKPCKIVEMVYDYVLIAVYSFQKIKEIENALAGMEIRPESVKVMVEEPEFLDAFMDQRMHWICDFAKWSYTQGMSGNVAECGVFRGDSAKFINRFFPDRKLYLFDTFEGFENEDIEYEISSVNKAYINSRFADKEVFTDTSIKRLMRKMIYPENIEIHKGHFPETVRDIEDRFCFVNLDMDLYVPMLEAIRYFWERMVDGGCILLHDYFNMEFQGVKKAVERFEMEKNIVPVKITIGDGCSIALIK